MTLTLYKKKRDFTKTPEPKGGKQMSKNQRFVVQKHDATNLHYDFRLEVDNVLKSWAVPKGPSTDPSVKRLAMMVEDHPVDYINFEGVIPKGNYGAGNVIVWDRGIYEPLENISHGLENGSIKVKLDGQKLNGAWALIKVKTDDKNSWLLVKERDSFADNKDITKDGKSVISGLEVSEVDKDNKILELLKELPKNKPPPFVKPMLSTLTKKIIDNGNFIFEIKWDGYRAIADKKGDKIHLYSRNNKSFDDSYPEILKKLKKIPYNFVLDGEVVVVDSHGVPAFQDLQNWKKGKKNNLVFYIFDVLYLNDRNLCKLPLINRKKLLEKIIIEDNFIKLSHYIEGNAEKFFEEIKRLGLEGIIAKDRQSPYLPGKRTDYWLKIKTHLRQEAIICGYTKPRGSRKNFGALILGVYKTKKLTYIGHTGGGFTEESLDFLFEKLKLLKRKKSPFKKIPKTNSPVTWVAPKLICEVSFAEWTSEGHMRHPIFEGLREDKKAGEVTVEKELEIKKEDKVKTSNQEIKISNTNKIFWPNDGYTKGDLIDYYKNISRIILPYLKDRPESLKRYPDGVNGKSFYQKNFIYHLPEFANSTRVYSESEDKFINYILCNNLETLLYIINLGCIELHPWNSKIVDLEKPDYMIFDLDPEEISFDKVKEAALSVRKVLEELDITSYPKTSGATGMHIFVPTNGKYTNSQVRQFAELIVNIVESRNPEFTSIARSPSKRKGCVYLDFLQNRLGQTLACAYSVRPFEKAPVSTPLKWSEIDKSLKPENFTIKNILKRIDKVGDLWEPVLKEGVDFKKALKMIENQDWIFEKR